METSALAAIANERRRHILRLVWHDELAAGDLARRFDVSWPAISQHLRVLKDAGLVQERRDGRRRYYRADRERAGPLAAVLETMWTDDLDRLADLAEQEQRRQRRPR
jgi:DNA-binding transcriptional ArsR family regulator